MLLSNIISALIPAAENEAPTLFPFSLGLHAAFTVAAVIFFIFRFRSQKRIFQLIMAIAIPFSMTIWLSESRTWFYTVGAVELVFMLIAFISSLFDGKSGEDEEKAPAAENSADGEAS